MSKSLPKAKTLWLKTAIVGIAVLLASNCGYAAAHY